MNELSTQFIKTRVSDYLHRNPRVFYWRGTKVDPLLLGDEKAYLPLFVAAAMAQTCAGLPRMIYDEEASFMFRLADFQPISQENEAAFFNRIETLLDFSNSELSSFFGVSDE